MEYLLCPSALLQTALHTVRLFSTSSLLGLRYGVSVRTDREPGGSPAEDGTQTPFPARCPRGVPTAGAGEPRLRPHPVGPQLQQPAASVAGLPPAATTFGTRHAGACSPQFPAAPGGRPLQEPDYNSQSAVAPPNPDRRRGLRAQRCRWLRSRTSAGGSAAREARRAEGPSPCGGAGCRRTHCSANPRARGCPAPEPQESPAAPRFPSRGAASERLVGQAVSTLPPPQAAPGTPQPAEGGGLAPAYEE